MKQLGLPVGSLRTTPQTNCAKLPAPGAANPSASIESLGWWLSLSASKDIEYFFQKYISFLSFIPNFNIQIFFMYLAVNIFSSTSIERETSWGAVYRADAPGSGVWGGGGGQSGGLPIEKELSLPVCSIIHTRANNSLILVKFLCQNLILIFVIPVLTFIIKMNSHLKAGKIWKMTDSKCSYFLF